MKDLKISHTLCWNCFKFQNNKVLSIWGTLTSIPNLIIRINDISTLVWFLITFYLCIFLLSWNYTIELFVCFSLNIHLWFSGISNWTFSVRMNILSFKPYLLLVFPMSLSVTSQHSAADDRHLGAIHSTTSPSTVLYSHSCPRQYHFHTRVQMRFSKFKYGLALCLKYFSDFGLLLVNYLMQVSGLHIYSISYFPLWSSFRRK